MQDVTQLFPVNLDADWSHLSAKDFSPVLADWLFDAGSLTARLTARCQEFKVILLGQQHHMVSAYEACEHIPEGTQVIAREVLLYCDNHPQVFARSLMPLTSLTGEEAALSELGDKPLGQAIFNSPHLTRGDFAVAQFDNDSGVASLAKTLALPLADKLWGRRSIFFLHDKPLAVAEVFLPNAFAYELKEVS